MSTPPKLILELKDVHTFYGSIEALKGISIEVHEGEIVTLIGANGAGKSTTLRSINGLNHPRQGTIHFEGKDITDEAPHNVVKMGISQSPEGRRLFPRMSVTENLQMGAFQRSDRSGIKEGMDRVFSLFPRLAERKNQKAGTLSGGEQQMCAIGRALMAEPKLLMLDEPSMGLAPIFVEKIFEIVREINNQGTPILLVEQNALMALHTANRGYVMETGQIVLADDAKALSENEQVQKTYLGVELAGRDADREVRRRKQVADPRGPVGAAVCHGERSPDPVRRDEAELSRGGGIPAAGDEHGAQALDGRLAGGPLQERQDGVA